MGFEKYFLGVILILAAITTFGLFLADASVASGHTSSVQFSAFNKTAMYQQRLVNASNELQQKIISSSHPQNILQEAIDKVLFVLQSVAVAFTSLTTSIDIGISLMGDVQGLGFVPVFFIGLATLWLIISLLLSIAKGIKQGDTE